MEKIILSLLSVLYLGLSLYEFYQSKRDIEFKDLRYDHDDLNQGFMEIKQEVIKRDRQSHHSAALSYLIASVATVISIFFVI